MLSGEDVPALSTEPMSLNTAALAARHHPPRPETEAYPWDENDWCVVEDQRWPCDAAALLSEIESLTGTGLDAAWAAAEAALPERAGVALVMSGVDETRTTVDGRTVQPYSARLWAAGRVLISREAASPAAALNALAAELLRQRE